MIESPGSAVQLALEWLAAGTAAVAIAGLLTSTVGPLVEAPSVGGDRGVSTIPGALSRWTAHRRVGAAFVAAALGLWWWEMNASGRLQTSGMGAAPMMRSVAATRVAAHLVLMALLAAASWIDLRHRVIPDAVTVPGALAGLLWTAADPWVLLPVPLEIPRSFATPLVGSDVLGPFGGLAATPFPTWLGSQPHWIGLVVAVAVFLAWWASCTAPGGVRVAGIDARILVAVGGSLWILTAWARGGWWWGGLITSLAGMTVAGGLVWLTRIGASWALGREALGFGDVTLMAMAGAWLGWQACLLACFLAIFVGLGHGLVQLFLHRDHELPFGPSLCVGIAVVVVAWRGLWDRCGDALSRPGELAVVAGVVIGLTALTLAVWRHLRPNRFSSR